MTKRKVTNFNKLTDSQIDELIVGLQQELAEIDEILDERRKEEQSFHKRRNELISEINLADAEQLHRSKPCQPRDIVLDDEGVRYRVHEVAWGHSPTLRRSGTYSKEWYVYGIRLTKNGTEAYAIPREIVSKTITVVK